MAKIRKPLEAPESVKKMHEERLARRMDEEKRSVRVTVLRERYQIIFDDYDMVPKTEEEREILRLKLELMAAEENLRYGQDCLEEGFKIRLPHELFMAGSSEELPEQYRSTGIAAEESDMRCIRQRQKNAVTRAASWNAAGNSNVL